MADGRRSLSAPNRSGFLGFGFNTVKTLKPKTLCNIQGNFSGVLIITESYYLGGWGGAILGVPYFRKPAHSSHRKESRKQSAPHFLGSRASGSGVETPRVAEFRPHNRVGVSGAGVDTLKRWKFRGKASFFAQRGRVYGRERQHARTAISGRARLAQSEPQQVEGWQP